jgi:hypothetical protein
MWNNSNDGLRVEAKNNIVIVQVRQGREGEKYTIGFVWWRTRMKYKIADNGKVR